MPLSSTSASSVLIAVAADLAWCLLLYSAGRFLSLRTPDRLLAKTSKAQLTGLFAQSGGRMRVVARLTYVAGLPTLLMAGSARTALLRFSWWVLVGTVPKVTLLVLVGWVFCTGAVLPLRPIGSDWSKLAGLGGACGALETQVEAKGVKMELTVSCIIPAWNEADRLPDVLACVVGHPLVDEVIVVDDASTDATSRIAASFGVMLIRQDRNAGKSAAVARGLRAAQGELVLLMDADLVGLTPAHITVLLEPLLSRRAAVSISLRSNAPLVWRLIGLDYISGERAMPRALLADNLSRIEQLRGFGLEVHMNRLWLSHGCRIAVVRLDGVSSPSKAAKRGLLGGIKGDATMLADIFRTVGVADALRQICSMRRARS